MTPTQHIHYQSVSPYLSYCSFSLQQPISSEVHISEGHPSWSEQMDKKRLMEVEHAVLDGQ